MSRHKLIKNLDLDEEIGDFDGGEDYDDEGNTAGEEEIDEEDQEQMRQGTIKVRDLLPTGTSHITDKQIQDALWHYYYDVEKSVSYLLNTYMLKALRSTKKVDGKKVQGGSALFEYSGHMQRRVDQFGSAALGDRRNDNASTLPCSPPFAFSVLEFFKDTPWLNTPVERQSLFIAPLCPRGGLPGGAPAAAPKVSKLQALAAARKRMAQEQKSGAVSTVAVEKNMAGLTLHQDGRHVNVPASEIKSPEQPPSASKQPFRGFPLRKRKDSNPHEKVSNASPPQNRPEQMNSDLPPGFPLVNQAEPSAFANTMFGNGGRSPYYQHPNAIFTMPYVANAASTSTNPFAEPSPDDIVIAAQSKATGKGGKGPPKTSGERKADQIANRVDAMRLDDTPRATSRNLDVLAEFSRTKAKKSANFVVIGHVDAGKVL